AQGAGRTLHGIHHRCTQRAALADASEEAGERCGAWLAIAAPVPATATAAAATGTWRARRLRARFVDDDLAAVEAMAVEHLDGLLRFIGGHHLDEAESARLAGELVADDIDRLHGAGLLKQGLEVFLTDLEGEVTYVQLGRHLWASFSSTWRPPLAARP